MEDLIFNGHVELSLRLLFLINNSRRDLDLSRILYYNYLLVHSSDIEGGPKSLHPNLPNRSCEILVLREIFKESISLLLSKNLIELKYKKGGIYYKKCKNSINFLEYFETEYSKQLDTISKWICSKFDGMRDNEIAKFVNRNLLEWGGEITGAISDV